MNDTLIDGPQALSCDVLVVGTGAGGASAAATLAEAGRDVLLLEEGPHIPAAIAPTGLAPSMLTMWRCGGLMSTLGTQIGFAEGRCVGGGTEINSAIFQHAPDSVIEAWAAANHIDDFSPTALAPYYERAAAAVNASLTPGELGPPTDILARAGAAMGWKVSALERGQRHCVGTNLCAAGCPTGGKQSMSSTLVPRALAKGARLISQTRVERLTRRRTRVTGAIATATDAAGRTRRLTISANSVFVCAGTMQTPVLLARSGLGHNAGRRFQLHPTIRVLARFKEPVNAHRYRLPLAAITEFMPELRFGGSIFSLPTYGMAIAEDWSRRADRLPDYAHHVIYYAMIKPDGVGRIHTLPRITDPIVTYKLTERDWRRLGDGVRLLAHALFAAGAEKITPSIVGHYGWTDTDALARDTTALPYGRTTLMTIHLFGSCPMGHDPAIYPVNSMGRLAEVENVVVADGSVLPGAPGVNPQATIMALAFRAADAFLAVTG
jgi:choline dehydrogenase-like flavoprotein